MKVRRQFRFTGQVQGVGFRFTAYHLALSLGVTGWVYNDSDGSVLMQAQGEEEAVTLLLDRIETGGRFIQIDGISAEELPLDEHERTFTVRT